MASVAPGSAVFLEHLPWVCDGSAVQTAAIYKHVQRIGSTLGLSKFTPNLSSLFALQSQPPSILLQIAKEFCLKHKSDHGTSYCFGLPELPITPRIKSQRFTMTSEVLEVIWPLPTSLVVPFMLLSSITNLLPPWPLWWL